MSHSPKPMSVMSIYRIFREGQLLVNRKYQRKLVWTLEEKQELIRSLLRGYPIPLVLLAKYAGSADDTFEIIDGMQRINAICAFLENEFAVDGHYFDVSKNTRTQEEANKGTFSKTDDSSRLLDTASCTSLIEYEVPVSVFNARDSAAVTDVFRRINSGGRHLSPQEARQAGVVGVFPDLVRQIAAEIRGDATSDQMQLQYMPSISIEGPRDSLGYGISASDTFWIKLGILNTKQLRESADEEIIADLVISVLDGQSFPASKAAFDMVYDMEGSRLRDLESKLATLGAGNIRGDFLGICSLIEENLPAATNAFRTTVRGGTSGNPCKTEFIVVFHACYRLIVQKGLSPETCEAFTGALKGLSRHLQMQANHQTTENRESNIRMAIAKLESAMVEKEPAALSHGPALYKDVENSLRRSGNETSRYECKQGLLDLGHDRSLNVGLLKSFPETLAAIANIGPGESSAGYFYFGVADSEKDATRIAALDGVVPQKISRRHVVGLDREAMAQGETLERYIGRITDAIQNSGLPERFKIDILRDIDTVDYRGMHVVRITVPNVAEPVFCGDELYVRADSSTTRVTGSNQLAVFNRFK
jgi:hypothetical protein